VFRTIRSYDHCSLSRYPFPLIIFTSTLRLIGRLTDWLLLYSSAAHRLCMTIRLRCKFIAVCFYFRPLSLLTSRSSVCTDSCWALLISGPACFLSAEICILYIKKKTLSATIHCHSLALLEVFFLLCAEPEFTQKVPANPTYLNLIIMWSELKVILL